MIQDIANDIISYLVVAFETIVTAIAKAALALWKFMKGMVYTLYRIYHSIFGKGNIIVVFLWGDLFNFREF